MNLQTTKRKQFAITFIIAIALKGVKMIFLSCIVAGFLLLSIGSMSDLKGALLIVLVIVSTLLLLKEATK